ncbi:hypothetical protein B0G82_7514 [Paraburkholderia sp. BL17N1]|nr:hypothetical protein B0G82_7514 [Paraburkholderia sp. BL17N1]
MSDLEREVSSLEEKTFTGPSAHPACAHASLMFSNCHIGLCRSKRYESAIRLRLLSPGTGCAMSHRLSHVCAELLLKVG